MSNMALERTAGSHSLAAAAHRRRSAARSRPMRLPTWDGSVNTQVITKVLIVTVVFPVFVNVILALVMVPVGFALTPLFARAGAWSSIVQKALLVQWSWSP